MRHNDLFGTGGERRRLRFGQFLSFATTVANLDSLPKNLTEGRFRDYWEQTAKSDGNDRVRFRAVLTMMQDDTRAWLDREFGWSESTALRYMQTYELGKSVTVTDLDLPLRGLYLLAAPSTPAEAREAVIERAEAGEKLTHAQVPLGGALLRRLLDAVPLLILDQRQEPGRIAVCTTVAHRRIDVVEHPADAAREVELAIRPHGHAAREILADATARDFEIGC